VAIGSPAGRTAECAIAARLAAYSFTAFKGRDVEKSALPAKRLTLLVPGATAADRAAVSHANAVADSVALVRDLVNTPPNALPPAALADAAREAVKGLPVKVKVWDEKALRADKCGGILAVGQGSTNPPRLVRLDYAPAGATASLALVGKGITFDTGGISIKPAAQMDEMKADMAGAAAVIGAVRAIAELGLPIRVTGWVPSAENMPSGTAQRPGDVITMYGGTTVEVLNTDAEGRLILADALGMAAEEKPDLIIDVATLTGAARVALGSRITGVMANDDAARTRVVDAADRAGEEAWPMPLPADLRASLDSATADLANIGDRFGGMLSAGVFLKEFVPAGQPWVHLDIAGPAFNDKGAYGYTPKGGTGAAVRTFVQVAADLAEAAAPASRAASRPASRPAKRVSKTTSRRPATKRR
jgi:leucyl aminopeptidase